MQIIDGKKLAQEIREEVKKEIRELGIIPGLAVVLIGNDPASHLYVKLKQKACEEAGIKSERFLYFETTPQKTIIAKIKELNAKPDIHGILVQLPLPEGLDENAIIEAIDPKKDVDGFHPKNIKTLLHGKSTIPPLLPRVILKLIESASRDIRKKNILILYNSEVFFVPLQKILKDAGGMVQKAKANDPNLREKILQADVLIAAVGRPNFITADMVKDDAVIIDVGTNRVNNSTVGDIDFQSMKEKNIWITPVPGGVGPMTVAFLLKHTLELAKKCVEK